MNEDQLIELAKLLHLFAETQNAGDLEDAVQDVIGLVEDTLGEIARDAEAAR